ncbi:KH domain-containing protein [Acaryochloris marina]|uniref:KH domain-containing protein n=1 Tax=Acaryochloris marina TaxID=155978 RepID=UPI001BB0B203|nr:KH domain-containing protein [Acaryochloris marina]QUY43421.1 KH domain-containing protein [Acaryochloris marina S15]
MPSTSTAKTDYSVLVRFLVEPFLEASETLSIDCETNASGRVWIRLAFSGTDKGRVFGRGGRTIQAMRTVLEMAGKAANQTVYLEVFNEGGADKQPSRPKKPPQKRRR